MNKYSKSIEQLETTKKRVEEAFFSHENPEGWKFSEEIENVKIWIGKGQDIHVKSSCIVKASIQELIKIFNCTSQDENECLEHRKYWDSKVCYSSPIQKVDQNHLAIQCVRYTKYSYFLGEREFLYIRDMCKIRDHFCFIATSVLEEEACDYKLPRGCVRGSCDLWSFILKPIRLNEKGKEDPKGEFEGTELTYMLECSPKGWIPSFVTKLYQNDQPMCLSRIIKMFQ